MTPFFQKGKGIQGPAYLATQVVKDISNQLLSNSFSRIILNLDSIIEKTNAKVQNIRLDQLVINLEVRGDVGFTLVGQASSGVKGTIQVTLKPRIVNDSI